MASVIGLGWKKGRKGNNQGLISVVPLRQENIKQKSQRDICFEKKNGKSIS